MSTSPIGSVGSPIGTVGSTSLTSSAAVRAPKQTMDSTVFMDLLVTQLKNQDPSSPMDTNAMINQTTQLSMMEKLTQLATDSAQGLSMQQRAAAAALIGKDVTYLAADGTSSVGTPSSVSYTGSAPTVTIGGTSVPLDAITGIATA
ncbi:flagellar hook assembly protein FlgD [Sinomonas atrocyanea]